MSLSILNAFLDESIKCCILPTEEELNSWLYTTSLSKSTNKLAVTPDIVKVVKSDAHSYKAVLKTVDSIQKYEYRVKSPESIDQKVSRHPDLRFQSVFNDILGIRITADKYFSEIPDYLRLVDMTAGKKDDDGYRAQHLYYRPDNFVYSIEIQVWSGADAKFNTWAHSLTYKYLTDSAQMLEIRALYDEGKIRNYKEFEQEVLRRWN